MIVERYIVLVANASIAHFYALIPSKAKKIQIIKTITHPASREKNLNLVSDKHGSSKTDYNSRGVSFLSDTEPKEVEKEKFIRQIIGELEQMMNNALHHQIILISAPSFMGKLNKMLTPHLYSQVKQRINKDFTSLSNIELTDILKAKMKSVAKEQHVVSSMTTR